MLTDGSIYSRIDWYRSFMDWTYQDLANILDMDPGTLRRNLTGETKPHGYHDVKIRKYYADNREEIDEFYDTMTSGLNVPAAEA